MDTTDEVRVVAADGAPGRQVTLNLVLPRLRSTLGAMAAVMVAAQLVWRAWALHRSYFAQDDFVLIHQASHAHLGLAYLVQDYNGHLMPGALLVVWLVTHVAPMSYGVAAAVLLVMQAVADVGCYLLLRRIFGPVPAILLPLAVFLFSPLTLPAFLWWIAGINALSFLVAATLMLERHVALLRDGRRRDGVLGVVALAAGLFFWEKALFIVPILVAVTALCPGEGNPVRRLTRSFRRDRAVWLGYVGLVLAYLPLYLLATHHRRGARPLPDDVMTLATNQVVRTFVPGIVGGGWGDRFFAGTLSASSSTAAVLVGGVLVVAVVVATVARRRGKAAAAWGFLLGYLLLDVAVLATYRLSFIGPIIGLDPRYVSDAVLVAALALGFAVLDPAPAPRRRRASWGTSRIRVMQAGLPIVLVAYVVSCLITGAAVAGQSARVSARGYVEQVRASASAQPDSVVFDGPVPGEVLTPLFGPEDRLSRLLVGLDSPPSLDEPTDDLRVADAAGRLVPADMLPEAPVPAGPNGVCGWRVDPTGVVIPLTRSLDPGHRALRLTYFTGQSSPAVVVVGKESHRVRFLFGPHDLFVVTSGPVSEIAITGLAPDVTVCVTAGLAGVPTPGP